MVDGLMHNGVVKSDVHSTDTHGYTEAVFGLPYLLGFSFAQRIKGVGRQTLHIFKPKQQADPSWVVRPDKTIKRLSSAKTGTTFCASWLPSCEKAQEMACMAPLGKLLCNLLSVIHVRRKFVDVFVSQGLAIAKEAIRRIADLYAVEKEVRGKPPDERLAFRQSKAKPTAPDLWQVALGRLPKSRA